MCLNNTVYWISILLQSHGLNWTWAEWQTKDLVCRHPAMRSFLSRLRKNPVWHPETHPDKTGLCVKRNHIVNHDLLQYMYFEHKGVNLARDIVTSEIICVVVIWAYLAIRNLAKNIWSKKGPLTPYPCQSSSSRHENKNDIPFSTWNVIYAIPSTPIYHELNWKIIWGIESTPISK